MRILHTADWHIGKRLERFPRITEQAAVLREIVAIADREKVDLVLVAGDLFDTSNPGSDAQELLYRTLQDLTSDGRRPVVAIAGNHDSPDRVEAPEILARRHGIILAGYPDSESAVFRSAGGVTVTASAPGFVELTLPGGAAAPVRILTTPYANEYRLRRMLADPALAENGGTMGAAVDAMQDLLRARWRETADRRCTGEGINLLVTHLLFAEDPSLPPEEPEGERPIAHIGGAPALSTAIVPDHIQYVACGHLHRYQHIPGPVPVVYSGSPLAYSFSEAGQPKSVTIVDLEPRGHLGSEPSIRAVKLTTGRPLVRHRAQSVGAALDWLRENREALVELTIALPEYLSGEDRRSLHEAHPGIVVIIPQPTAAGDEGTDVRNGEDGIVPLDPTGDIHQLFERYFVTRHGTPPDKALRHLFVEVLGAHDEQEGGDDPPNP